MALLQHKLNKDSKTSLNMEDLITQEEEKIEITYNMQWKDCNCYYWQSTSRNINKHTEDMKNISLYHNIWTDSTPVSITFFFKLLAT